MEYFLSSPTGSILKQPQLRVALAVTAKGQCVRHPDQSIVEKDCIQCCDQCRQELLREQESSSEEQEELSILPRSINKTLDSIQQSSSDGSENDWSSIQEQLSAQESRTTSDQQPNDDEAVPPPPPAPIRQGSQDSMLQNDPMVAYTLALVERIQQVQDWVLADIDFEQKALQEEMDQVLMEQEQEVEAMQERVEEKEAKIQQHVSTIDELQLKLLKQEKTIQHDLKKIKLIAMKRASSRMNNQIAKEGSSASSLTNGSFSTSTAEDTPLSPQSAASSDAPLRAPIRKPSEMAKKKKHKNRIIPTGSSSLRALNTPLTQTSAAVEVSLEESPPHLPIRQASNPDRVVLVPNGNSNRGVHDQQMKEVRRIDSTAAASTASDIDKSDHIQLQEQNSDGAISELTSSINPSFSRRGLHTTTSASVSIMTDATLNTIQSEEHDSHDEELSEDAAVNQSDLVLEGDVGSAAERDLQEDEEEPQSDHDSSSDDDQSNDHTYDDTFATTPTEYTDLKGSTVGELPVFPTKQQEQALEIDNPYHDQHLSQIPRQGSTVRSSTTGSLSGSKDSSSQDISFVPDPPSQSSDGNYTSGSHSPKFTRDNRENSIPFASIAKHHQRQRKHSGDIEFDASREFSNTSESAHQRRDASIRDIQFGNNPLLLEASQALSSSTTGSSFATPSQQYRKGGSNSASGTPSSSGSHSHSPKPPQQREFSFASPGKTKSNDTKESSAESSRQLTNKSHEQILQEHNVFGSTNIKMAPQETEDDDEYDAFNASGDLNFPSMIGKDGYLEVDEHRQANNLSPVSCLTTGSYLQDQGGNDEDEDDEERGPNKGLYGDTAPKALPMEMEFDSDEDTDPSKSVSDHNKPKSKGALSMSPKKKPSGTGKLANFLKSGGMKSPPEIKASFHQPHKINSIASSVTDDSKLPSSAAASINANPLLAIPSQDEGDDDSNNHSNIPTYMAENERVQDQYGDGGDYTGSVSIQHKLPHGEGTMKYDNARFYQGEWVLGRWHGHGTWQNPNGDRYEGSFVMDARSGSGKYSWQNGNTYEGEFVADRREGQGIFKFQNGNQYRGAFENGVFQGHGRYDFEGGHYEGEWKEGRYHGQGYLLFSDGSSYTGAFAQGVAHGQGEETSVNGSVRVGKWSHGKPVEDPGSTSSTPPSSTGGKEES